MWSHNFYLVIARLTMGAMIFSSDLRAASSSSVGLLRSSMIRVPFRCIVFVFSDAERTWLVVCWMQF